MERMARLIEIRNLSKVVRARQAEGRGAARTSTSTFEQGDFLALMGPSGSGKTTLLNLIGGLDAPTPAAGSSSAASASTSSAAARSPSGARANVGFVFQFYNLMPVLTAQKNVELPLLLTKLSAAERQQARRRSRSQLVGLADRARAQADRALRRPAAARRDRPRDRLRPDPARLRRADRRPRPRSRPRRCWACCRRSTASTARPS